MLVSVRVHGDLFASEQQTLVNPVNAPPDQPGVMGAGLALRFKQRFPGLDRDYQERLREGSLRLGRPCLWKGEQRWVLNFPTKRYWWEHSDADGIQAGLKYLAENVVRGGITGLSIPALGCGLGGLAWSLVEDWLVQFAEQVPIPVEVYAPW